MPYYPGDYEKCKVYVKSKDFKEDEMNEEFGVEIGFIDNYSFRDYKDTNNKISNTKINLNDHTTNREFLDFVISLKRIEICMFFVGTKSNKVLHISGELLRFIEIEGNSKNIRYSIQNGKPSYTLSENLTVTYQNN